MRELHLFAGAGGGILGGALLGHLCVGAVEINRHCRSVLTARQQDGSLPSFPIHDDIRTFDGTVFKGAVDVVCGGFPCQPWSIAGKMAGSTDSKHLWPEMARVISEVEPTYVFAENVTIEAFREPYDDLQRMGFRVAPALALGAIDVGAPHRRTRWWMLAANTNSKRFQEQRRTRSAETTYAAVERNRWWAAEPSVGRVDHGVADRVERILALGNGQVPAVAATAFRILMQSFE